MTIFNLTSEIEIDPVQASSYQEPLRYLYDDISVEILPTGSSKNLIQVKISTKNSTLDEAQFVAESELLKISNVLSWENTLKIKGYKINSIDYINENGGRSVVVRPGTLNLKLTVNSIALYGPDTLEKISKKLSAPINPDFHEVLIMWREALAEDSRIMQFFLCYRIIEFIKGGRINADKYIQAEDKNIPLVKDRDGKNISLYTFLRDNIHAKTPNFPFKEIDKSLGNLRFIVSKAIKQIFPTETA